MYIYIYIERERERLVLTHAFLCTSQQVHQLVARTFLWKHGCCYFRRAVDTSLFKYPSGSSTTFLACANGPMAILTDDASPRKSLKKLPENAPYNIQKDITLAPKLMPMNFWEPNLDFVDLGCPRGLEIDSRKDTKSWENLHKNIKKNKMSSISEQLVPCFSHRLLFWSFCCRPGS